MKQLFAIKFSKLFKDSYMVSGFTHRTMRMYIECLINGDWINVLLIKPNGKCLPFKGRIMPIQGMDDNSSFRITYIKE